MNTRELAILGIAMQCGRKGNTTGYYFPMGFTDSRGHPMRMYLGTDRDKVIKRLKEEDGLTLNDLYYIGQLLQKDKYIKGIEYKHEGEF